MPKRKTPLQDWRVEYAYISRVIRKLKANRKMGTQWGGYKTPRAQSVLVYMQDLARNSMRTDREIAKIEAKALWDASRWVVIGPEGVVATALALAQLDSPLYGAKVEEGGMTFVDASGQDIPPEFMREIAKAMQATGVLKGGPNALADNTVGALDVSFDDDGKITVEIVPQDEVDMELAARKVTRN